MPMNILTVNLLFSTFVYWIAARIYLLPRLADLSPRSVLVPMLLLHAMRHLGLMFLSPGAVYLGIPSSFAWPAAIGDLIAALLALACIAALRMRSPAATALLWIFSIEGFVDLMVAITLATVYDAEPFMGPAYWIPAFWVPALLVTHVVTVIILVRHSDRLLPRDAPA
jgi:hypothetical protein